MNIVYKFTDSNCITYNNTVWIPGEWKETNGEGSLCGTGWLHAYSHPLIAVLHDPIHGTFLDKNNLLWQAEASGKFLDDNGVKCGYSRMRLIEQIPVPTITTEQRVKYAILCAKEVYTESSFISWADNWLNNIDRSEMAAQVALAEAKEAKAALSALWATWAAKAAKAATWATALTAALAAAEAAAELVSTGKVGLIYLAERAMQ